MPGTLKIIKHFHDHQEHLHTVVLSIFPFSQNTFFFLTEVIFIQGAFKNIQGLFKDIPQFFNFQGHDAFLSPYFLRPHRNPVGRVNFCKDFRDCYTDTWDRENKLANSCLLTGESLVTIP